MHSDAALKVIMDCGKDEPGNVKRNVGFRLHDVINTKEQANNIKINKRCI